MSSETPADVLIIGAGPTGLTLAVDLARRGVTCRIIEQSHEANRASKAKAIQPRALEVLDDLGAAPFITARGLIDLPTRFHEPSGVVVDKPTLPVQASESFSTPYPNPVWIGQFDVEAALRRRLELLGGAVEYGVRAIGAEQDSDGVTVTVSTPGGERSLRARYVVAADGGKSGMRKIAGLPLMGKTYEKQRWYLGDVTTTSIDRDHMHIWTSERGMIGLTPLPGSDLWQFQSPIRPEDEPDEPSLEFYQAMLDERAGKGTVTLTSATWLSVYRVNVRMVEHYRQGRIFLAGDAAHVHSPAGGQGMATGIQDAYNLGWKLAAVLRGAKSTLLDTYGLERIPVARAVLEDSTRKMQATMKTITGSSDAGLSSALGSIADDITTGLPIGYPDSPLTLRSPQDADATVFPGDRAPDAAGLDGPGFTGTMFDLLRGPQWTLVAFEHRQPLELDGAKPAHLHVHHITASPAEETIHDSAGAFQRHYHAIPDELFLIRPDGYLAARVPGTNEADIINHLAAFRPDGTQL
ncbi:FAD-dependent oxidoreductase [Streptomyces sp. NPDC004629]|uniref:FAD-dependent oxidoreductase n=1 Tax=Streptomyces sp. NPDC004629 TaxID=3364705 RepID=UPI003673D4A5